MDRYKNLREWNMNVISHFTICVKREFCEWQFSMFFMILSEKLALFCAISAVKSVKLLELDINSISQFRTEVKHDSVKC